MKKKTIFPTLIYPFSLCFYLSTDLHMFTVLKIFFDSDFVTQAYSFCFNKHGNASDGGTLEFGAGGFDLNLGQSNTSNHITKSLSD